MYKFVSYKDGVLITENSIHFYTYDFNTMKWDNIKREDGIPDLSKFGKLKLINNIFLYGDGSRFNDDEYAIIEKYYNIYLNDTNQTIKRLFRNIGYTDCEFIIIKDF